MSEDLLFYAQLGRADHIRRLITEAGTNPDWSREDGVTTLMMAAMTGRVEVMDALLDSGATIDLQSPDGTTALLAACTFARTTREIAGIELLLGRGAQPNLANTEGNDPLMLCARHGLVEAVIVLLKGGADPLRRNRHGTTALMQASRGHLIETVRVLLRAGADRGQLDERGLSALRYAHELGPPPPDLRAILAPSDLGSLELTRRVSRFDKPWFKIALLGSWTENEIEEPTEPSPLTTFVFLEVTGERQITVEVTSFTTDPGVDAREGALENEVREQMDRLRHEDGTSQVTEVRYLDADQALQARFSSSSTAGPFFVAACVYATSARLVTMLYRDFRPNLTTEARGRQAGESVASFRVK